MPRNKKSKTQVPTDDGGISAALGALTLSAAPLNTDLDNAKAANALKKQKRNVVSEFEVYFGDTSKLTNWQMLCFDIGLGAPPSIRQCKLALKGVWVNIWDFLDAVKAGVMVPRFESELALSLYTKRTKRFYPKRLAKKEGPVKALLAHIRR